MHKYAKCCVIHGKTNGKDREKYKKKEFIKNFCPVFPEILNSFFRKKLAR